MTLELGAVVPAAGLSRRMRREKILLRFGASTVLEAVLDKLAGAGVVEVVVVLRRDLAPAAELARRHHAHVVFNERPDESMLVSMRLGLDALSDGVDAFFFWPCDHPAVAPPTLQALAAAADRLHAVIPRHHGRRGHPVVVGADLRAAIASIPEGQGLRHLWRMRPEAVREIDVEDPGILVDLDTPEDYDRLMKPDTDIP